MFRIIMASLTDANRAKYILDGNNIYSVIEKVTSPEGCKYAVKVNNSMQKRACELMKRNNLNSAQCR